MTTIIADKESAGEFRAIVVERDRLREVNKELVETLEILVDCAIGSCAGRLKPDGTIATSRYLHKAKCILNYCLFNVLLTKERSWILNRYSL